MHTFTITGKEHTTNYSEKHRIGAVSENRTNIDYVCKINHFKCNVLYCETKITIIQKMLLHNSFEI